MALNDTPLPGYPTAFGNKWAEIYEHIGPTSYTTGGETISASQFGFGGFDWFETPNSENTSGEGNTYSGTYTVLVVYSTTSAIQGSLSTIKLKWIVASTGVEATAATNLSAEVVRCSFLAV